MSEEPETAQPPIESLDAPKILETVETLGRRIEDRFPDSNLRRICAHLWNIARKAQGTSEEIARPILGLRIATIILVAIFAVGFPLATILAPKPIQRDITPLTVLEVLEWTINDVVYIGLAIIFLVTLEIRIKRRRALKAIHELRSLAHIIDMHQLTKDPDKVVRNHEEKASSPKQVYTAFELTRYLDYCTEMLSLVGKIAALYVESFDDSVALSAVNEVESLTTGLSRKMWQKIMILDTVQEGQNR